MTSFDRFFIGAFKSSNKALLSTLEFIGRPFFYLLLGGVILLSFLGTISISFSKKHKIVVPKSTRESSSRKRKSRLIVLAKKLRVAGLDGLLNVVHALRTLQLPKITRPKIKKSTRIYPPLKTLTFPKIDLKFPRRKKILIVSFLLVTATSGFLLWQYIFRDLPSPKTLTTRHQAITTRIFDRKGRLLFKFYKNQNRTLAPLLEIPLELRQATIAIEDKDFYTHPGVSIRGIARAVWRNLSSGTLSGGSTITQQLVKNALLTPQKSWERKIKEAILAIGVELDFTKDQILEMYLNEVPYGGSTYGVSEASETYFGKRVQDLSLAESAYLAGLPASPSEFSPFGEHPELAKMRQQEVLYQMVQNGYITQDQSDQALNEKITLREPSVDINAPHFVMYVKSILAKTYGESLVDQGGLQVFTSLDLGVQNIAQETIRKELDKVKFLHITQGAALITNPKTGEILAMVGSRDYFDIASDGNVNATTALRQPGSSIKPVNYAVALENGFTPATIIPDTPITYQVSGQPPYSPLNYDRKFHGNVPLRIALASSYNVPAVKVLAAVGVTRMIDQGKKMGITTWNEPSRYGLSLTLGGGDVRMTDMAVVYGTLANLGLKVDLQPILRVENSQGNILEKSTCTDAKLPTLLTSHGFLTKYPEPQGKIDSGDCKSERALDPKVAYLLNSILSDNNARTPAFGSHSDLVIADHDVSVKTGTTNNLKDNWTIGFTSDILTAVWVGNFDSSPMSYVASGVTGASPIWNKIMTQLLKDKPNTPIGAPTDIQKLEICTLTGTLSCSACPTKKIEYFLPGTAPTRFCTDDQIKKIQEEKAKLEESQKPNP